MSDRQAGAIEPGTDRLLDEPVRLVLGSCVAMIAVVAVAVVSDNEGRRTGGNASWSAHEV